VDNSLIYFHFLPSWRTVQCYRAWKFHCYFTKRGINAKMNSPLLEYSPCFLCRKKIWTSKLFAFIYVLNLSLSPTPAVSSSVSKHSSKLASMLLIFHKGNLWRTWITPYYWLPFKLLGQSLHFFCLALRAPLIYYLYDHYYSTRFISP